MSWFTDEEHEAIEASKAAARSSRYVIVQVSERRFLVVESQGAGSSRENNGPWISRLEYGPANLAPLGRWVGDWPERAKPLPRAQAYALYRDLRTAEGTL
jgi:hypothetical protein